MDILNNTSVSGTLMAPRFKVDRINQTWNSSLVFDFFGKNWSTVNLPGGTTTFSSINRQDGLRLIIFVKNGNTVSNIVYPPWIPINGLPNIIDANKNGILRLFCTGPAENDIFAEFSIDLGLNGGPSSGPGASSSSSSSSGGNGGGGGNGTINLCNQLVSFWGMDELASVISVSGVALNSGPPVYYWPLTETNGTRFSRRTPLDLIPEGSPGSTVGIITTATSFDTDNPDGLVSSTTTVDEFLLTGITISAWVKLSAKVSIAEIVMHGDNFSACDYIIGYDDSNDVFQFGLGDGSGTHFVSSTLNPELDVWYLVLGSYDGNTGISSIWVNGVRESQSLGITPILRDTTIRIGTDFFPPTPPPAGVGLDGLVCEVSVWDRVLSDAEIAYIYNNGVGRSTSNFSTIRYDLAGDNDLYEHNGIVIASSGQQDLGGLPSVAGFLNNAVNFTGNGADFNYRYLASYTTGLSFGNNSFTVGAYVNIGDTTKITGNFADIVSRTNFYLPSGNSNQLSWDLYYDKNSLHMGFDVFTTGGHSTSVASSTYGNIQPNTWYHTLAYYDKARGKVGITINGQYTDENNYTWGTYAASDLTNVGGLVVGMQDPITDRFQGSIDEVGIWDRILNSAEIARLQIAPRPSCISSAPPVVITGTISGITPIPIPPQPAPGNGWFVAPEASGGSASNNGSVSSPWNLYHAMSGGAGQIVPGDTIYLRGGHHVGVYRTFLEGTPSNPITFRRYPGETPVINGANFGGGSVIFNVQGQYLIFRDFTLLCTPTNRVSSQEGSYASDLDYSFGLDNGGSEADAPRGYGNKFINLVAMNFMQNFAAWSSSKDVEFNGCISLLPGWLGTDRGHGHAYYCQNHNSPGKLFKCCVASNGCGEGIQAYTADNYLDNLTIDSCVMIDCGSLVSYQRNMMIGGGSQAQNPKIVNNFSFASVASPGNGPNVLNLSYDPSLPGTNGGEVTNNYLLGGGWKMYNNSSLSVNNNKAWVTLDGFSQSTYPNNTYYSSEPTVNVTGLFLSDYTPKRAMFWLYNPEGHTNLTINLSSVNLQNGDLYQLRNVNDYHGPLVANGTWNTATPSLTINMTTLAIAQPVGAGLTSPVNCAPKFGCFVVGLAVDL